MRLSEEKTKEIVIAMCDWEYDKLEEFQEDEELSFLELDFLDTDIADFIEHIHRYTAEQYIKRAVEVLDKNKDNEDIKEIVRKIVPTKDLKNFEYNKHNYKNAEHYF
nr:hypothetical protein [uncultured Tyzzerella sp.]